MDFSDWYRHEHPAVAGVLLALTGNQQMAEDIADEAFAKAWKHWRRLEEMESPGGWVHATAVNGLRRQLRRMSIEQRLLRRQTVVATDEIPDRGLWELVRRLPERQRLAVALRYVGDLPEQQVAEVMGISRGTVAATLSSARKNLDQQLKDER